MVDLLLKGEFGKDITVESVTSALPLDSIEGGINVIIDSIGGNLFEAIKVTEYLKSLGVPLKATAIKVASAATWVFFNIEDRCVDFTQADEQWLFIHEARLKPADMGSVNLTAEELRGIADRIDQFNQMLVELYANQLGISKAKAAKIMKAETWVTPDEVEEYQIVATLNKTDMSILEKISDKLDQILNGKGIVAEETQVMKTKDGSAIKAESISVGESVSIVKDGVEERFENGVLHLEDGRYVVVQWGSISYIIGESIQAEAVEAMTDRVKASLPAPEETTPTDEELQAKYDEAQKQIAALQAECDSYKAAMTEKDAELKKQEADIMAIEAKFEKIKLADIATTNALPEAQAQQPRKMTDLERFRLNAEAQRKLNLKTF